jgi:PHP family Zn ribbon phosphoesterase
VRLISVPFDPDYIILYSLTGMKTCSLCKEAKKKNENFDNSKCPHCDIKIVQGVVDGS